MHKFKKFISITIGSLVLMVVLSFIFDHRATQAAPAVFISTPATTSPTALQNFSFTIGTTTPLTLFGSTTLAVYGSTTIHTWRNTTNAFIVLDSATSTVFRVDTINRRASTSAFVVSNLLSCDTIDTNANGVLACGSDATGVGSVYPFTPQTFGGTEHSASTTRPFYFGQGLLTSSSTIGTLTVGILSATSSFQIPNDSNPTVDAIGEIAFDTTSGFLILATSTTDVPVVYARPEKRLYSFVIASTSISADGFANGDYIALPTEADGIQTLFIMCSVWGGTNIAITLRDDSGNATNSVTCTTTSTTTEFRITSGGVFTAGEGKTFRIGAITGTPNYLNVAIYGTITRD